MTRAVTVAGYAAVAAAMVACQAAALAGRRRATLGDAVRVATARPAGRLVVLGAWLWIGWHVFVRFGG